MGLQIPKFDGIVLGANQQQVFFKLKTCDEIVIHVQCFNTLEVCTVPQFYGMIQEAGGNVLHP